MALGGDQGGSIRIPAAWCGVLGLKPTHSLVPYTGIGGIDQAIDHAGPLARNAEDLAALLQAIAGPDRSDPRQYDVVTRDYVAAVQSAGDRLDGVRIGILAEGFSADAGVQDGTARAVRESAERLAALGATLVDVSVPEHLLAGSTGFVINLEGMAALIRGGGTGYGFLGRYSPDFSRALGSALARGADELSLQAKTAWIVGSYLSRRYHAALYAAAQNDVPRVRGAYDRALADVDMLLMPTAPFPAFEPATDGDVRAFVQRGWANLSNTSPFNMTGHPAISLPMGSDGGLPVGTMLVGRHFDDDRLLSVARTYEMAEGWQPLPVVADAGMRTDRTFAAAPAARS
jgi:amidase